MEIIITAPSLDNRVNVSGVSSVTKFIIDNNPKHLYLHFLQGKADSESASIFHTLKRIITSLLSWNNLLSNHPNALVHYNFPLNAKSIFRDFWFMESVHRKKMIMVIHLHGGMYLFRKKRPFLIDRILRIIFGWGYPVIALSDDERKVILSDFHFFNVHVLPNCVKMSDAKKYERSYEKDNLLHLLYLGRIEPNKGIDDLLAAAIEMKSLGVNFVLHIAGKEEKHYNYIKVFRNRLGGNFVYEGIVFDEKKNNLMRLCDVFILPSLFEGLPMSLLETMSYGIIPIITNVGSIPTIVKSNINGILIPTRKPSAICNAVEKILSSFELRKQLSLNAKRTIFQHFSSKEYIQNLNEIYKSAVD